MRRVKYVCPSSAQKIGSQQQKLIKVSIVFCPIQFFLKLFTLFSLYFSVIQALIALVNDPEPEHPLRADLAEEYQKDRKKFNKSAEEFTKKYSEKRPTD